MKTWTIHGESDDIVSVAGPGVDDSCGFDEIGAYNAAIVVEISTADRTSGLKASVFYAPKWAGAGVWTIEVAPLDEDVPMPDASLELGGRGYSPVLTVKADDHHTFRLLEAPRLEVRR